MELRTAEEELGRELAEIYKREYQKLTDRDSDLLYMPATDNAKWWCSCGVMNLISQTHCRVCGASIADLSKIMWKDYLQGIYDKEHPAEAKVRKERETEEAAVRAEAEAAERAVAEKEEAEEIRRAAAEEAARVEAEAAEAAARAEAEEARAKAAAEAAAKAAEEAAAKAAEEAAKAIEAEEEARAAAAAKAAAEEEAKAAAEPVEIEEEQEAKIEISLEEPAEEPVKLTASNPDEPKPVMLNVTKPDEPEMGKIASMADDDNEYEDTRLGEAEDDDTTYYDMPKGATPEADTVLGIPSEPEEASVSMSSDISFPDSDDEEMTEAEIPNIVFGENYDDDKEAADISDISFPSDLAEEYAAEVLTVETKEASVKNEPEPMTMGIDDIMADIGEIEEADPTFGDDEDDGPLVKLEEAIELPGFGKVQSMDADPEEDSVEFFDAPDDQPEPVVAGETSKKSGRFGGLFGKKKDKEIKQPETFAELKLKEDEPLMLEKPETKEEEELPMVELPAAEEEEIPMVELPKAEEEEIPMVELPKAEPEEPPVILFPDEEEEEELPIIELKQVPQGEIPSMPFSSEKKEAEPSVIHDEEGNPQIVFPDSPSSESRFGDFDELDFPDATIPESPLPDPVEKPVIPRVEFPDGPQMEVEMNPTPGNKEKARPFRNPGAAEKTPSGLTASEGAPEAADKPEAVPAKEHDTAKVLLIAGVVIGILALLFLGFLAVRRMFGNSEVTSAVETAAASIQKLQEESIPTQEDFNKALSDYNAVPYDRKNEVGDATILERFKDVDLKTVRDIATRMDALSEKTPFADIMALESEYEKLTVQEKQFVDGTKLDGFKSLNEMEKTALKAAINIRSLLTSGDNFKVTEVKVKDDTGMSMSYRMQVSYSYVDEQGTLKQVTTYLSMMSESDDVAYNEAVNSGKPESYTKNTKEKSTYDKCESDEIEIDNDKLMYYLNS